MSVHWHLSWNDLDERPMDVHGPLGCNIYTPTPFGFHMYDDDGVLYFSGACSEISFDPLDDYGEAFGCTRIDYWQDGEWRPP